MKKLDHPLTIKPSSRDQKRNKSLISPALSKLRKEIDVLDRNIWSLLSKRFALTKKVAKIKQKMQMAVYDAEREKAVLAQIRISTPDPEVAAAISELYKSLFGLSKTYQQPYTRSNSHRNQKVLSKKSGLFDSLR